MSPLAANDPDPPCANMACDNAAFPGAQFCSPECEVTR